MGETKISWTATVVNGVHCRAIKISAGIAGVSVDKYIKKRNSNQKWCSICKEWHYINEFGKSSVKYDGLTLYCRKSINERRSDPLRKKQSKLGEKFVKIRNGDKKQARSRINHMIVVGLLPKPNDMPCENCGHIYNNDMRHEYHHYLGYKAENQEDVQILCTKCHVAKHPTHINKKRDKKGRFIKNGTNKD